MLPAANATVVTSASHRRQLVRTLLAALLVLPVGATLVHAQSKTYVNGENNATALDTTGDITLTVEGTATATQAADVSGPGGLNKTGDGTLLISGLLSHTGDTIISAGTLSLDNGSAPFGILSFHDGSGAGLGYSSRSFTNNANLTITSTSYALVGPISGSGSLTKSGLGILFLVSANTFTGNTIIHADGTVMVTETNALQNSTVNNDGTVRFNDLMGSHLQSYNRDLRTANFGGLSGSGSVILERSNYEESVDPNVPIALTVGSNNDTTTFSGTLSGTGTLTKTGTGTLTLSGDNTYTGTTTVSGGTLQIGNGGTIGSLASAAIINDANLTFNRSDAHAYSGVISGTGTLTKTGTGTLTLTGDNTYTGATTISGGTLQIGDGGTSGSLASDAIINDANLTFNRSDAHAYSGVISGTGTLTKTGTGTLTLTGANTYSGGTTVTGGALAFTSDANLGHASGDLLATSGATLNAGGYFGTNRAITLDGPGTSLNNNGELIIGFGGTGSLTLTNGAAVTAFNLDLAFNGGVGTINVSSGSTINAYHVIYYGSTSTINVNEGGTLTTTIGISGGGIFNLAGGTLRSGGAYASAQNITLTNASTVDTNGHATTLSGVLSGAGSLTKTGAGTLTLSQGSSATGTITVSEGTLVVGSGSTATLAASGITNNAHLVLDSSSDLSLANLAGSGDFTKTGSGVLTLPGMSDFTGEVTVAGGTLDLGANSVSEAAAFNITAGGVLRSGASSAYTQSVTINGAGAQLIASSVISPPFDESAYTFFAASSVFGRGSTAVTVSNGGSLSGSHLGFGAYSDEAHHLLVESGGTVESTFTLVGYQNTAAVTATITGDGSALNVGNIDDGGGLIVGVTSGTGTVNVADGGTVDAVAIVLGFGNGNGVLNIDDGGVVATSFLTLGDTNGDVNGTANGTVNLNAGGVLRLTSYTPVENQGSIATAGGTGSVNFAGGTLDLVENNFTTALAISLAADTTSNVSVATGLDATLSGVLSGAGGLQKSGQGTLTLAGANTLTGGVAITGGTLALGANGTLANVSSIHLGTTSAPGMLDLTAKAAGFAFGPSQSLTGSGVVALAPGQVLTVAGTLAPGDSPGLVTVQGDLAFTSTTVTLMELASLTRGTGYDAIDVTGSLTFDGTLTVTLLNDFSPLLGDSFQLFQATSFGGTFAQLNLPTLAPGLAWDTDHLLDQGTLYVSAIPEPSAFAALAGLGVFALTATRRRVRA